MPKLADINITSLVNNQVLNYLSTLQLSFAQLKILLLAHEPIAEVVHAIEQELLPIAVEEKRNHFKELERQFLERQAKEDREEELKDSASVLEDKRRYFTLQRERGFILSQQPTHVHSVGSYPQRTYGSFSYIARLSEINYQLDVLTERRKERQKRIAERTSRCYQASLENRLSSQNYQLFTQRLLELDRKVDELFDKKFSEAKKRIFPFFLASLRQKTVTLAHLAFDEKQALVRLIDTMSEFLAAEQEKLNRTKALRDLQETISATRQSIRTSNERIFEIASKLQRAPEEQEKLAQKNQDLDRRNKPLTTPAWLTLGTSLSVLLLSGGLYFAVAALGVTALVPPMSLIIPMIVAGACLTVSLGLFAAKGINRLQKYFNNKQLLEAQRHEQELMAEQNQLEKVTIPELTYKLAEALDKEPGLKQDLEQKSQVCDELLAQAKAICPIPTPSAPPPEPSFYTTGASFTMFPPPSSSSQDFGAYTPGNGMNPNFINPT
ncbi:hypothetical protein [Legionella impletisoli]|uniref:LegC3 N-terminal Legionellaceae domain-containing protein n=1 Tax=Legionella impletisoli TaxID=343510 RepID=A0A917JYY8_9GAMM|nr:hypothetical protein [Legionella impletisoli]GGI91466.1 hypothetical protein GCM10007966_20180 [Legionella impletisoli]